MLRKIRLILAVLFFTAVTLLFLDFTGTLHAWLGWTARIQFLPALLALNAGVVIALVLLTLLFGRVYCSVICPLGVMQDIIAWGGKKRKKNRYTYSPARSWLRYGILAAFIIALVAGASQIAALVAPYSSYGRIASNLFAPLYGWCNNLLAFFAERADSYAFYETDVWLKSLPTFLIALVTFILIGILAWKNGRTYCNTVCPVGTVLGFLARFSWFKPVIDTEKCVNCRLCERNCKASCINISGHSIDYSRCVSCMDCIDRCSKGAVSYRHVPSSRKTQQDNAAAGGSQVRQDPGRIPETRKTEDASGQIPSRRNFLAVAVMALSSAALKAQEKKVDGGLAVIEDKKIPDRSTPILPPGASGARHFSRHCTACQLCVSVCPNGVLRPSSDMATLMQPEMSYERGYCRPECTKCGEVCPAGAIRPVTTAEKSSIQIGRAVWISQNCIPLTDGVECGNCARHCPTGAIQMVPFHGQHRHRGGHDGEHGGKPVMIPAINVERCIGCGACENLCPARPFSAIYVEGNRTHREL